MSNRLVYNKYSKIWILNLSAGGNTELGYVLYEFFYNSHKGKELREMADEKSEYNKINKNKPLCYSGYPHNGGSHILHVSGELKDVAYWYQLFYENFKDVKATDGCQAIEFESIKKEFEEALVNKGVLNE